METNDILSREAVENCRGNDETDTYSSDMVTVPAPHNFFYVTDENTVVYISDGEVAQERTQTLTSKYDVNEGRNAEQVIQDIKLQAFDVPVIKEDGEWRCYRAIFSDEYYYLFCYWTLNIDEPVWYSLNDLGFSDFVEN